MHGLDYLPSDQRWPWGLGAEGRGEEGGGRGRWGQGEEGGEHSGREGKWILGQHKRERRGFSLKIESLSVSLYPPQHIIICHLERVMDVM